MKLRSPAPPTWPAGLISLVSEGLKMNSGIHGLTIRGKTRVRGNLSLVLGTRAPGKVSVFTRPVWLDRVLVLSVK